MWNFIHLFTGVESNVGPEDQMLPDFTVLYTLSSQKNVFYTVYGYKWYKIFDKTDIGIFLLFFVCTYKENNI